MAIKTFTTGEVLTASDTNTYLANSGLVFVKSQTVGSGVAEVIVPDAFSADYDNYKIIYSNGVGSTTTDLRMRLGSTATGYAYGLIYLVNPFSSISILANNGTETTFPYIGGASTNGAAINVDLIDPFKTKYTYMNGTYLRDDVLATVQSGGQRSATSFTAFTITTGTGTITGGSITVYGYRKG
jgi:hypothetical protein